MLTGDLNVRDLKLLVALSTVKSLRALAAATQQNVSSVSRRIIELEAQLGVTLLARSNLGVTPTAEARLVARQAEQIVAMIDGLAAPQTTTMRPYARFINVGGRGFLNAHTAPVLCNSLHDAHGESLVGWRFFDLSPDETVAAVRLGVVDMIIAIDKLAVGKAWQRIELGALRWGVYGNPAHPIFIKRSTPDVAQARIGHQCFFDGARLVVNDGMLWEQLGVRQVGHGAQTAATALAIAEVTHDLVCAPEIVARAGVAAGRLRSVDVAKFDLTSDVFLYVHSDRMSQPELRRVTQALKRVLLPV